MALLVFVPIILGIVLTVVGSRTGNESVAYAGKMILSIGIPATMFVLVVVGLILMITGRLSDDNGKTERKPENVGDSARPSASEGFEKADVIEKADIAENTETAADREAESLADINSSYGYESQYKAAEYQMEHVAENYKNSTRSDKIKGWLFFGFLMTDFALIIVFLFLRIMTGCFICFGIFAGTIIISLIVVVIRQKKGMSRKGRKGVEYVNCEGTVKSCVMSSMSSTGGSNRNSTMRVNDVVYKITLDVDGNEYVTYGRHYFNVGEKIPVALRADGKSKIVTNLYVDNGADIN